jgi:hypothetical protein
MLMNSLALAGLWQALGVLALLLLGACHSIAHEHRNQESSLINIGKSTKSDVLGSVGLPSRTARAIIANAVPIEQWIYLKRADWSSVTVSGPGGQSWTFSSSRARDNASDVAMIVEFSEEGVVIAVTAGPDSR